MSSNVRALKPPVAQLQLRMELEWVMPPVWRVVLVPETIQLHHLHQVIQIAMGWLGGHLHEFMVGEQRYGEPDPEWDVPGSVIVEKGTALVKALGRAKRFRYIYDFGDGWEHRLTVERRLAPADGSRQALCVAGENACPPEDVGGPPGYDNFLQAIADPSQEEHEDMLEWCGGSFDPTRCDIARINRQLKRLRL
jgi:Plasmid pRiA4b ORF-3-like protein